ncbi:MAG: hypothetical protein ABIZ04_14405 [Opitutus sp.]
MRPSSNLVVRSSIAVCLIALMLGAAACLWIAWCEYPVYAWNEVRLIPAFAFRDGINVYPNIGEGPVFTWIYGPVGFLVNLPATFASTPLRAVRIAGCINGLVVLGPLALIFLTATELRRRSPVTLPLALSLAVMLIPWPNLILQVADHTAIACGLISLWILAKRPTPKSADLALVAGLAVLAVWSKQIAVFLAAAEFSFLFLRGQRGAAWRYFGLFAFFNLIALAVFASLFGFANLWLNLVEIPARLGWADFISRLEFRRNSLVGQVLVPLVAIGLFLKLKGWPKRETESGRFLQLGILAFLAMLPVGLFAFFKVGGDINLLHSWDYLMPAALLYGLATEATPPKRVGLALAATVIALVVRSDISHYPKRPFVEHFAVATALTSQYPHKVWFPQNPIITYFADRKIWHSEDGVSTRFLAGYGIKEAELQRNIPPQLQALAYPSVNTFPFSLPLFADFNQKNTIPYWVFYTRPVISGIPALPAAGPVPASQQ